MELIVFVPHYFCYLCFVSYREIVSDTSRLLIVYFSHQELLQWSRNQNVSDYGEQSFKYISFTV